VRACQRAPSHPRTAGQIEVTWPAYTGDCGVRSSFRDLGAVVRVFSCVCASLFPWAFCLIKRPSLSSVDLLPYPSLRSCIQSQRCLLDTQECSQSESVFDSTLFILPYVKTQKSKPALPIRADFPPAAQWSLEKPNMVFNSMASPKDPLCSSLTIHVRSTPYGSEKTKPPSVNDVKHLSPQLEDWLKTEHLHERIALSLPVHYQGSQVNDVHTKEEQVKENRPEER
jgi:hypothetical protein